MARVWKDIFRSGIYKDQSGEIHRFTPAHIRQAHKNLSTLLNLKHPWTAPAIWEHDTEAAPVPMSTMLSSYAENREKRAKTVTHRFGHAVGTEIRMEAGKPVLWAEIEIPDPEDVKQFEEVGYVSPRIDFDATDPKGRKFPGASIFHIAATNRPIQIDQKTVSLSSFSKPTGWKSHKSLCLSELPMANESEIETNDDTGTEGGDDISQLKSILAELGHPVPDEASDLATVILCLKTHAMEGGSDDGTDPEEPGDAPTDGPGMTGSVAPAMLSALPANLQGLVQTSQRALANVTSTSRKDLLKRLSRIEPVAVEHELMTVAEIGSLKQKLTSVNLSFDSGGNLVRNQAIRELDYLERLVRNIQGKRKTVIEPKRKTVSLSSFGPRGGPIDRDGNVSDADFLDACKKAGQASAARLGYVTVPAIEAKK